MRTLYSLTVLLCQLSFLRALRSQESPHKPEVLRQVDAHKEDLLALYRHLHSHPEISFHEEKTSARVAEEMRRTGLDVTERVGGWGVVAVLKNGPGKTILVRTDLDALPIREMTFVPYASKEKTTDDEGKEVSVMHACGHDMHMTCWVGVARVLSALKDRWRGTIVFIGQPAEERVGGAAAMLKDGLYDRFPKPQLCLALHCNSEIPAGTLGLTPGLACSSVDTLDITIHGVGGHGAMPHSAKDPIVLASEIVLALQTIRSREIDTRDPMVVTVGSIHGGSKHNIIPDKVELQLTVRTQSDEVHQKVIAAIHRICRGLGVAAGVPEDLMPEIKDHDIYCPVLTNDPATGDRLEALFKANFGAGNVVSKRATLGGEDFSQYGLTKDKIPTFLFWLGAVPKDKFQEAQKTGQTLPSVHSPFFRPDPEPTVVTGVAAMSLAVLDWMEK